MDQFTYAPSLWVPFRDTVALDRVRRIKRSEIDQHPNPDFRIHVMPAADIEFLWIADMFHRISTAATRRESLVLILPNPCPMYRHVAHLINKFGVDCRELHIFGMDEYADQDGKIAPPTWPQGLVHAMLHNFWLCIDETLRPPESQVHGLTNNNLTHYGSMITDLGEADVCYSGPGWTGHLGFIEPDAPEFAGSLEEWKRMGPRLVTLSPFTLAQNSLHGSFGMSGDLALVPPRAATIGPAQVIAAKARLDFNYFTIHGTATTWQRLITRLAAHGPVTPRIPTSIHQTLRTDFYISEVLAQDIEPDWQKGY